MKNDLYQKRDIRLFMSDNIVQTFTLLATFNIALVAVAIANYAVSASYLGRETRLTRTRMERRKKKLSKHLAEMQKDSQTNQIPRLEKEIDKAKKDIRGLNNRIFFLSWVGAVILPSSLFLISFIFSIFGMNVTSLFTNEQAQITATQGFIVISAFMTSVGFVLLFVVIRNIDSAAKNSPVPVIEMRFLESDSNGKIILKNNIESKIHVDVRNTGEDMAENTEIYIHFPPQFKILKSLGYKVSKSLSSGKYPDYSLLYKSFGNLHIGTYYSIPVKLQPSVSGTFKIPITVCERKIGTNSFELELVVED
jgi:hypothetical protein